MEEIDYNELINWGKYNLSSTENRKMLQSGLDYLSDLHFFDAMRIIDMIFKDGPFESIQYNQACKQFVCYILKGRQDFYSSEVPFSMYDFLSSLNHVLSAFYFGWDEYQQKIFSDPDAWVRVPDTWGKPAVHFKF